MVPMELTVRQRGMRGVCRLGEEKGPERLWQASLVSPATDPGGQGPAPPGGLACQMAASTQPV